MIPPPSPLCGAPSLHKTLDNAHRLVKSVVFSSLLRRKKGKKTKLPPLCGGERENFFFFKKVWVASLAQKSMYFLRFCGSGISFSCLLLDPPRFLLRPKWASLPSLFFLSSHAQRYYTHPHHQKRDLYDYRTFRQTLQKIAILISKF